MTIWDFDEDGKAEAAAYFFRSTDDLDDNGGSGGCGVGLGALALIALLPLAWRKKR